MAAPSWSRLIRFKAAEDGKIYHGEPQGKNIDLGRDGARGVSARIIKGPLFGSHELSTETRTVQELLCPVAMEDVVLVRCVGLNYVKHIQEGWIGKIPEWVTLFIKPRTALAGPDAVTFIPKIAQDTMDYEAELCVVIGKTGKDIKKADALEHVLGFTCGNDVSWRKAQQQYPQSGSQWCFGKGLDGFAPIGPALVSPSALDTSDIAVKLRLNGELMQDGRTSEMLHTVEDIVAHFSLGTTLEAGTVLMTGTPQGVGYARKPPVFLKDGDKVEVEIEGIGTLKHSIKFE